MDINDMVPVVNALYPIAEMFELRREAKNVICPFHKERKPSAHIYPGHLYCFTCGKQYRAVQIAHALGMDIAEMYSELLEKFGDEETLRKEYEFHVDQEVELEVVVKPRFANANISEFAKTFFANSE